MSDQQPGEIMASACEPLSAGEALRLERIELDSLVGFLRQLTPDEWDLPTRTPGRDLLGLAAHIAGSYAAQSNLRQLGRQIDPRVHAFYREPGEGVAERVTRVQIGDRLDRRADQIVAEIERAGERAIRWRTRVQRPFERIPIPAPGRRHRLLRNLSAQSYLFDLWFHRLEFYDATSRGFTPGNEVDRRIFESRFREIAGTGVADQVTLAIEGNPNLYRFGDLGEEQARIVISPAILAKRIVGWQSAAATRERATITGDVKTAMTVISALGH